jgi:hypothetical protein
MNKEFSGSLSPDDQPSRPVEPPERRRALEELKAEDRSCQLADSLQTLGVGSVSPPRWMHAHLTQCLSCLNDFARLQGLNSHPAPARRRRRGSDGFNASADHMLDVVQELGAFMLERKTFWLLPIVVIVVLFGGLIVLTQGAAVAPFIYALW